MIAFAKEPEDDGKPESPGGKGPSYLSPTQENKIAATLLNPRRRWKITKSAKQAVMQAMLDNLTDDDPRVVNGAAANLIRMEAQNQADQHKMVDKKLPDLHTVGGVIEHYATVPELLVNPDYLEWLRERERSSDPRLICQNGHQGNGKPLDDGSACNGH